MQGNTTTTTTTTSIRTRKKTITTRNSGSVWENRMKMDQVKGGIKVFNGGKSCNYEDEDNGSDGNVDEEGTRVYQRLRRNQSDSTAPGKKKRRNWTPPAVNCADEVLIDKSPIQLRKARSELSSNSARIRAMKSLEFTEKKKPVLMITDGSEGGEDDKVQKEVDEEMEEEMNNFYDKEMDLSTVVKNVEEEKTMDEIDEIIDETEFVDQKKNSVAVSSLKVEKQQNSVIVSSVEVEKQQNSVIDSSVSVEKKQNSAIISSLVVERIQNPLIVSSLAIEKNINHVVISSVLVEKKQNPVTKAALDAEKKQIPGIPCSRIDIDSQNLQHSTEFQEQEFPAATHDCHKMQSIADLIMWRDVSKSAFVFGLGTFILISSSYTKDFNFSLISATSYLGLIYLALIFTYKSILHRGESTLEFDDRYESYIVGEEEIIWLLRMALPYINGLLVSLKALFSGDPATTMKLAVLLFVMARCGSSITVWNLIKLVFFGVFTVPKVCSSYSYQLAKYGKFWLNRFRDGWESCTHKKAVAAGIFTIIWNISSTVARIWDLFMLVVAFKLYQQCVGEVWASEEQQDDVVVDEIILEDSKPVHSQCTGLQNRQRNGAMRAGVGQGTKVKKWL